MPSSLLDWFTNTNGLPRILADLKSGRAGLVLRIALSFAAAALAIAAAMVVFGLIDSSSTQNLRDEHIGIGLACAFGVWCAALAWVWAGYRHWRRTIRTGFIVLGVWAAVIALSVIVGVTTFRGEFFIASIIITGIGVSIAIIAAAAYQGRVATPVLDSTGTVNVACPNCNYSLVGLETTTCPECGSRFTIDQLIKAQGYGEKSDEQGDAAKVEASDPPAALRSVPQLH